MSDDGGSFVDRRHVSGLLSRSARSLTVALGRRLANSGVSFAQYLVLVRLWRAAPRPIAQSELAADLAVERSSMSTLLSSLEQVGLVRRASDTVNTRRLLVSLTERGRALEQPVLETVDAFEAELVAGLGEEELGTLRSLLERLQARAGELRAIEASGYGAAPVSRG